MSESGANYTPFFKWLGRTSGKVFNTYQAWDQMHPVVKQIYEEGADLHLGNVDSMWSGAAKGLIEGTKEYAKEHPLEAAKMGVDLAKASGVTKEQGQTFAEGFLETVDPNLIKSSLMKSD